MVNPLVSFDAIRKNNVSFYSDAVNSQISAFKWSIFKTVYKKELRGSGFLGCQEIEIPYFIKLICATALGYETRKPKIRTHRKEGSEAYKYQLKMSYLKVSSKVSQCNWLFKIL